MHVHTVKEVLNIKELLINIDSTQDVETLEIINDIQYLGCFINKTLAFFCKKRQTSELSFKKEKTSANQK